MGRGGQILEIDWSGNTNNGAQLDSYHKECKSKQKHSLRASAFEQSR